MIQDDSFAVEDHDGCTLLCPKILKSDISQVTRLGQQYTREINNCVFERAPTKFENIIKLSEMSLINGLSDTLFNEFCENNALNSCSFSYYTKKQNSTYNEVNKDLGFGPYNDYSLCCERLIGYFYILKME